MKRLVIFIAVLAVLNSCNQKEVLKSETLTATDDGAWCWFSDPRAIYVHGESEGVLTGWVKEDGTIEAALIADDGTVKTEALALKLEKDDHANPAFVEVAEGNYMVFYTKHFDDKVRYHRAVDNDSLLFNEAVLFDLFDEEELKEFPLKRTTYANPYYLKEEDKLYCFGRWTGFKPNMIVSEDQGETFSKARVLISNYPFDSGNRPYAKYYSDGGSKIHIAFTDGHPRNEPANSVYYACYENGSFWRADGSKICSIEELPFTPKDASVVYKADTGSGKSWVFDISSDKDGHPVVLFVKYPTDTTHQYFYARYDGHQWQETKICDAGRWFPQTQEGLVEREPNYSGAMTLNPVNSNHVFVSEQVNGVFEIVQYNLNKGRIVSRMSITADSELDNVRPFFPRNMKEGDRPMLLWMRNHRYVHYTDFHSSILYRYLSD